MIDTSPQLAANRVVDGVGAVQADQAQPDLFTPDYFICAYSIAVHSLLHDPCAASHVHSVYFSSHAAPVAVPRQHLLDDVTAVCSQLPCLWSPHGPLLLQHLPAV